MKNLFIGVFLGFISLHTSWSFAFIENSSLSSEVAQNKVYQRVQDLCNASGGRLEETSSRMEREIVDNGIEDFYYQIEYTYRVRFDQGQWDEFRVLLDAVIYSAYDHENSVWGVFRIDSATCEFVR